MAASSGSSYRNFLNLLKKWPVDKSKSGGRDLGEHLRLQVAKHFRHGEASVIDEKECLRTYGALSRIAANTYKYKYPRSSSSTATGLTPEECYKAQSNEVPSRKDMKKSRWSFCHQHTVSKGLPSVHHVPIMVDEVLEFLKPDGNKLYIDMTFGAGGHTRRILESSPAVKVITLDRDPVTWDLAQGLKEEYPKRVIPLLGKFSELPRLLKEKGIKPLTIDGILMDLGVSSMQFDNPERGFMLSKDGPLDMRMDGNRFPSEPTAADILAHINEISLYKVLKYYGEEKRARTLARAIVESRYLFVQLKTTQELANFVSSVVGMERTVDKLKRFAHPATKTFQALRILVNDELNELDFALHMAHRLLRPGGVLTVISFHSLEDTIVKRHIQGRQLDITPDTIGVSGRRKSYTTALYSQTVMERIITSPWQNLTKHVVVPSEEEVKNNPRARSAKLRAVSKV